MITKLARVESTSWMLPFAWCTWHLAGVEVKACVSSDSEGGRNDGGEAISTEGTSLAITMFIIKIFHLFLVL